MVTVCILGKFHSIDGSIIMQSVPGQCIIFPTEACLMVPLFQVECHFQPVRNDLPWYQEKHTSSIVFAFPKTSFLW